MSTKKLTISKDFSDRLLLLMEKLGFANRQHTEFAKQIQISSSFLSDVLNQNSGPSFSLISGIAKYFPTANIKWLLTGEGGPLLEISSHVFDLPRTDEYIPGPTLINMTGIILNSKTEYSSALAGNIRAFYNAIRDKKELNDLKTRVSILEEQLLDAKSSLARHVEDHVER